MHKKVVIILTILLIAGLGFFYFHFSKKFLLKDSVSEKCIQKANLFFEKINTSINQKLDYSFANNDSVLKSLLGDKYRYISEKDNNCYVLVKNYNPMINEYRYSILNADTEILETVLIHHELEGSSSKTYREEFISKHNQIF